jgi:type I restriction enzyme S subunit
MTKLIDITGKALSGEWGNEDESGNGIPVLRTTNFTNEGVVNFDNVITRVITKKNIQEKFLKNGDIILEKSGGSDKQPVGRVVYFEGPNDTYLFNNFTGLLRVKDQTKWLPKFVFYSLYSNYRKGGTIPFENKTTGLHNLKTDDYVARYEVVDLPYLEQQIIVETLDKTKAIIDARNQELQTLDELIKARFVEMFGDPISNSKHLSTLPMTDVCNIIDGDRGKNYPKQEEFEENGYCLFLNAKNVTSSGFNFDNCMFISKEKDELLRAGKLSRGDVVLTTRGTLGNLAFYTEDIPYNNVRINSGMVILRMNRNIINEVFFIEQFKQQLSNIKAKIASGSAQPQLPISTMNKIQVVIDDISKQNEFAEFVQEVDKSKVVVQKALDEAQLLFDSLMQQYFG